MDRYDELKSLLTLALTKIKALEGRIEDLEEESFLDMYETTSELIQWNIGSEPKREGTYLVCLESGYVCEADYEDETWVRYYDSTAEPLEDYLAEVIAYAEMPKGVESEDED